MVRGTFVRNTDVYMRIEFNKNTFSALPDDIFCGVLTLGVGGACAVYDGFVVHIAMTFGSNQY